MLKPLPVPHSERRNRRAGRRLRMMRERYTIADMRRLINRMQFGVPEERSLGDGMLGQADSGKQCVSVDQSKVADKEAKKFKEINYGSSGATSRLAFSADLMFLSDIGLHRD